MDIPLSQIIAIDNLQDYKIHFAVWNGTDDPLDVFVRDWEEWVGWNSWKGGWSSSKGGRNDFNRTYVFSLIRFYPQPQKWLFGGIFEVLKRNTDSYVVELLDQGKEFIGRLLVQHPGPGVQGRAFKMENYFTDLNVSQILEHRYEGEAFCGADAIVHGFSQLEAIFTQSKSDWKSALENVKGVYLITDTSNGKMYVGSAYGDTGIWSRWSCYIDSGHGWNEGLKEEIKKHGLDYARKNFQFSVLEIFTMKTDDQFIIDREQHWKSALLTRTFGYNKN